MALLYVTKASNLAFVHFLSRQSKAAQNKTYCSVLKKRIVNALSKVVGFLRVLRFLPTRNIAGYVVWMLKIRLTLWKLFIRPVQGFLPFTWGEYLKKLKTRSFTMFLKKTKRLFNLMNYMFLSHIFSLILWNSSVLYFGWFLCQTRKIHHFYLFHNYSSLEV